MYYIHHLLFIASFTIYTVPTTLLSAYGYSANIGWLNDEIASLLMKHIKTDEAIQMWVISIITITIIM